MEIQLSLKFLLNLIFLLLILLLGLVGSLLGLFMFVFNRKLRRLGPVIIYKCLFVYDLLTLLLIPNYILLFGFNINISTISSFFCKSISYISLLISAVSSFLLTYISLDRLVSIRFPSRRKLLKNKKNQILFILILTAYEAVYYVTTITGIDLTFIANNNSSLCYYINYKYQVAVSIMDLLNRSILPFILMTTCSIALVVVIFLSRGRVKRSNSIREKTTFKRDVKFSITTISLNLVFLVFRLPYLVLVFNPRYSESFLVEVFVWLLFVCYAENFYILFITNSLFRYEVLKIFGFKRDEKIK